jgi:hypothetical protein
VHPSLVNEVSDLLDAVALWKSATYDEGMAHVKTLTIAAKESSQRLEVFHKPMTTLLDMAKKKGLAATASKRAARWSLVKHWEAHGLGKNLLNFLIDLKIASEPARPPWLLF